jgi:hypothetical protein
MTKPLANPQRTQQHWTRADVLHMRWYAERGFSAAEAGAVMGRTGASVARKASECGISFHGPSGAPFLNQNGKRGTYLKIARAKLWDIPDAR